MAFPADYTRLMEYELPTITGSHSNFALLMKYDDFTSAALSSIDDGGGDLRFSSDSLGTNQLACEVVEFDKVGNNVTVWVKIPTASTAEVIHIWGDNAGDSQPLVTDTYGRNAVWSDYDYVLHLNDSSVTDSTGNFTPTLSGSVSVASGAYFGDGLDFTGGGRIDIPSVSRTVDYQLQALTRLTSDPSANHWIVGTGGTSNSDYGLWSDNSDFSSGRSDIFSGTFRTGSGSQRLLSTENSAKGGNSYSVAIKNDSTTEGAMLVDGVEVDVVSNAGISSSTDTVYVGNSTGFGTSFNGVLQEIRARNTPLSDDHLATEHSNYSTVGAWGISTDVGGGGATVTSDLAINWNTLNTITSDVDLLWNILQTLNVDKSLTWDTFNTVSKDNQFTWNIANLINSDIVFNWNTANTVSSDNTVNWDILATLNKDLSLNWDILNQFTASTNLTLQWNILNKATNDLNLDWNTLQTVFTEKSVSWNIFQTVFTDKSINWDTFESVINDLSISYNILNKVDSDLSLNWDMVGKIVKDLAVTWNTLNKITSDKQVSWNILQSVFSELDVRYGIFNSIDNTLSINWNTVNITNFDLTLEWDLNSDLVFETPSFRTVVVASDNRVYTIPSDDRKVIVIPSSDRKVIVK